LQRYVRYIQSGRQETAYLYAAALFFLFWHARTMIKELPGPDAHLSWVAGYNPAHGSVFVEKVLFSAEVNKL
jgi:hypothetical protein